MCVCVCVCVCVCLCVHVFLCVCTSLAIPIPLLADLPAKSMPTTVLCLPRCVAREDGGGEGGRGCATHIATSGFISSLHSSPLL